MNITNYKQRGVGLIEVLASLVILAVGLLSVATLHVNIIDSSNDVKTENEAIIIAQSRIEELRNFSDGINTPEEFEDAFVVVDKGNSTNITGINAAFTRKESIADANSLKNITIYVTWHDKNNDAQEVFISSSIGWERPRSAGSAPNDDFEPLIPSATGRARLGDGYIDIDSVTTLETGDGMLLYDSLDGDYRLVDSDGTIVLTLEDACDLDGGNCTDFVRISGRVYIDNTTQRRLAPGNVFVKASDAAYCQQYYFVPAPEPDAEPVPIELISGASIANQTSPNNNYTYYNYTCYLGGGWHGNIGLILSGGIGQSDKICQGDPTSIDAYADPVIAARRVYRGMTYKYDADGAPIVDANGDTIYYSIGVSDALELPASGDSGHDFVISSLNVNDTTGDKCISEGVMVRADSFYSPDEVVSITAGKLFEGIPTDFFCLNQDSSYIDNFDTNVFKVDDSCPFDPSDPPSLRHVISGIVLVNTDVVTDEITDKVNAITVNTSDGRGNCTISAFIRTGTQYTGTYECDVYDWGTGWNGYIQLNTDYSIMACDHYRETYSTIAHDTIADDNICNIGDTYTVAGTVTPNGRKVLTDAQSSDLDGQCQVADDGLSYSCNSDLLTPGTQWTGRLTFETNGSKLCINDPILPTGSFDIVDGDSSTAWIDIVGVDSGSLVLTLEVIGNNEVCP